MPADAINQAKTLLQDLAIKDASPLGVARMLNCPYDQFRRSFKLATGLSPHQYHLQAVLQRARELLEGTNMSVKAIAAVLDFSDQYYFAKIFKRKTGASPSQWREQVRRSHSESPASVERQRAGPPLIPSPERGILPR